MAVERVEIRLFGSFQLLSDGRSVEFPASSCDQLIALLALKPSKRRSRRAVADQIWPDAQPGNELQNLRATLSRTRRTLGEAELVKADTEHVWIDPDLFSSDLQKVERLAKLVLLEPKPAEQEQHLQRLRDILRQPLLEGWEYEWVAPLQVHFASRHVKACLDLMHLREGQGRWDEAIADAEEVLRTDPWHEEALAGAMRCDSKAGRDNRAIARYDEAKRLMERDLNRRPSSSLRKLAEDVSSGRFAPPADQKVGQRDLVIEAFEASLASNPDSALAFIASNRAFWVFHPDPPKVLDLLGTALRASTTASLARAEVMFIAASFLNRRSQYYASIEMAEEAIRDIEVFPLHKLHLDLRALLGINHAELREFELAEKLFREALALGDELGDPAAMRVARNNYGVMLFHQLRFDEARDLFHAILAAPGERPYWKAHADAVARVNLAFMAAIEEDWPEVAIQAKEALETGIVSGDRLLHAGALSNYTLASIAMGHPEGREALGDAASMACRAGMPRYCLVVLDQIAEAFALLGLGGQSKALLEIVRVGRDQIGHRRSLAEQRVADRVAARVQDGEPVGSPALAGKNLADIVAWVQGELSPK